MTITRIAKNQEISVEQAVEVLDRDGAIIFENLADPDWIDAVDGEIDPYLSRTPNGEGLFFGRKTRRMGRLFLKSPSSRDLATHPLVLGVTDAILTRYCSQIQINLTQAIRIEPGEQQQIFHNDDEFFPFEKKEDGQFMLNAMWACTDFTKENGATRLVPGSHKHPVNRHPAKDEICYAEMPRGSVLVYLGSCLHSGGANRSTEARTGIAISYCLGWLRQAENQYLAYPPEVARHFPRDLQRLIGYAIHEPNLGWYEGQDPRVLFADIKPEFLAAHDNMPVEVERQIEQHYQRLAS